MSLRIVGRDISGLMPCSNSTLHVYDQLADALERVSKDIFFKSLEENHSGDLSAVNAVLMQNAKNGQKNISRLIEIQEWIDSLIKNLESIRWNCENSPAFPSEELKTLTIELNTILSNDFKIVYLNSISDYKTECIHSVRPVKEALACNETAAACHTVVNDTIYEVKQIYNSIIYQICDNKKHITDQLIMRENKSAMESVWSKRSLENISARMNGRRG